MAEPRCAEPRSGGTAAATTFHSEWTRSAVAGTWTRFHLPKSIDGWFLGRLTIDQGPLDAAA